MIVSGNTVARGGAQGHPPVRPAGARRTCRRRRVRVRQIADRRRGAARRRCATSPIDMPNAEAYLQFARNTRQGRGRAVPGAARLCRGGGRGRQGAVRGGPAARTGAVCRPHGEPGVCRPATHLPGRARRRTHQGRAGLNSRARDQQGGCHRRRHDGRRHHHGPDQCRGAGGAAGEHAGGARPRPGHHRQELPGGAEARAS